MTKFQSNSVGSVMIPDGTYLGTVTGFRVKFKRGGTILEFAVKDNSNQSNLPVNIIVNGMRAKVIQT